MLSTFCRVTFRFKSSRRSNNGSDVGSGQIPEILYRIPEVEKDEGVQLQLLGKDFSSTVSAVSRGCSWWCGCVYVYACMCVCVCVCVGGGGGGGGGFRHGI